MTTHPIDRDRLRTGAESALECGVFDEDVLSAVPALLDALAAAEHRATRAEAQNADEIRAIAEMTVYSEQALQEAAELMHSVKLTQAEARIKAVRDVLAHHSYGGPDQEDAIRRALNA